MNDISLYLNAALGACFIIVLIFLDYVRKFNTDIFQRRLYLLVLGAAFFATATDFIARILAGMSVMTTTLYAVNSLFYVFQFAAYYVTFAFVDYFAYGNIGRTKKIIRVIVVLLCLWCFSLVFNLRHHFYFYIEGNVYIPGPYYAVRLMANYLIIPICIIDMIFSSKSIQRTQVYLVLFFGFLTGAGAALDIIMEAGSLTWPCFTAGLLYIYFFIVRSDAKIDSLTGIGNRYSFNAFIDRLARQGVKKISFSRGDSGNLRRSSGTRESWAIVMIDMDQFKRINDTLGHLEGDNALKDMAAIIKGCIRHSDFAARYGGDEFVLATRAENDILRLMDRIKDAIKAQNEKKIRPYTLEISYGYDIFTTGGEMSIDDFMVHVDSLMYKNKAEHRRASDREPHGQGGGALP